MANEIIRVIADEDRAAIVVTENIGGAFTASIAIKMTRLELDSMINALTRARLEETITLEFGGFEGGN